MKINRTETDFHNLILSYPSLVDYIFIYSYKCNIKHVCVLTLSI
jgi:hypothetical protein